MELSLVQQINGDVRIDDAQEDGPMMSIKFFAEFAKIFSDEEKFKVLEAAADKLESILRERPSG